MTAFAPKTYQAQVLESVEAYFHACHELPSPSIAYTATTERLWGRGLAYNPLAGFPTDMPYFCLRVPTGGGKTWLAAKSVALVNTHLLRSEHSVILWLVPSKPIREQTLRSQFQAMETALGKMNSQSSWLASQLGQLNANSGRN